ncbi:hypothetical protein HMH01_08120 [Halovulum dunhuangense]|uniref:Uncharacterized protein n=1 Tax=Halovulum dunhuangense TaxID=1505036 RepID=A0A849L2A1_9RHOB|nr:hypothetical protein [Halovulum dunhuangense]NNU80405.1 hypothetical protein [Halovulum dunhuangense]
MFDTEARNQTDLFDARPAQPRGPEPAPEPEASGLPVPAAQGQEPDADQTPDEAAVAAPVADPVTVSDHSEKTIIVRGVSKDRGAVFGSIKGRALWNEKHYGWVLSKKWRADVEALAGRQKKEPVAGECLYSDLRRKPSDESNHGHILLPMGDGMTGQTHACVVMTAPA